MASGGGMELATRRVFSHRARGAEGRQGCNRNTTSMRVMAQVSALYCEVERCGARPHAGAAGAGSKGEMSHADLAREIAAVAARAQVVGSGRARRHDDDGKDGVARADEIAAAVVEIGAELPRIA